MASAFPPIDERLQERRALLLEAAAQAGILVPVTPEDAAAWTAEWRAAVRALQPRRRLQLLTPRRGLPRLTRPPQRDELPPVGSWVSFQPHISSAPEVFQVLAFVPVGTSIAEVLTAQQLRLLQDGIRWRCTHGDRVVLGEPGGMHLIASIRTALAGAVAARATVIPEPFAASASRLVAPLSPGSEVFWQWHSSFGPSRRSGVVVAYVPGRVPLGEAAPGLKLGSRLRSISTVDRYLVQVAGEDGIAYLTPPAFLVERPAVTEDSCSTAS